LSILGKLIAELDFVRKTMRLEFPGSNQMVGVRREMKSLMNLSLDMTGEAILMPWLKAR
tara:strand:- start:191 stop:367 length:177 start_codon:yes stop_codon:yes gene_type:complete